MVGDDAMCGITHAVSQAYFLSPQEHRNGMSLGMSLPLVFD